MSFVRFLALILAFALFGFGAGPASAEPLKIAIEPAQKQAAAGDTVLYRIDLLDARGAPAAAVGDMSLEVTITPQSGSASTQTLVVAAGQSSAQASFEAGEPGLVRIQSSHPSLIAGEGGVMITPAVTRTGQTRGIDLDPADDGAEPVVEPEPEAIIVIAPSGGSDNDPAPAPEIPAFEGQLSLFVPDKDILADGVDSVSVDLFLKSDDVAPSDIRIVLSASRGELADRQVVIPRGELFASTTWTSTDGATGAGVIRIESVSPQIEVTGPVTRNFVPPIHKLHLTAAPAKITLIETGTLLAELRTINDVPVVTDRDLKLTLSVLDGMGTVKPVEVVFREGDSTARAEVRPSTWGRIVVSGQIPSRPPHQAVIVVGFAFVAFAAALVGGTVGGFLSWLTKRSRTKRHNWRIVIGTVTGLALFAGILFLGKDVILDRATAMNIQNPWAVFFIALLGGWMGTAILTWFLEKLGIKA